MINQSDSFELVLYEIVSDRQTVKFYYRIIRQQDRLEFVETLFLPKKIPATVSSDQLNEILTSLHLMLGVSYWKLYCPSKIKIPYVLSQKQAKFWNIVYTKGLGEFFYKNKIDFRGLVDFPYKEIKIEKIAKEINKDDKKGKKSLIGIGGGKDSVVAVEMLKRQNKKITGFIVKNSRVKSQIQEEMTKAMGINSLTIKRTLDPKLSSQDQMSGIYRGHLPITAINVFIGLLLAIIYGYSEVLMANEKSASFGNVEYLGEQINHQWSKSQEFEQMLQRYIATYYTSEVEYGSVLGSMSELEIAKEFVQYEKYFPIFSSCNRNFSSTREAGLKWCGECPKCAFVFLTLAAYLSKDTLMSIFKKDLFSDEKLLPVFKDLLGKGKMKPFECVGTFEEAQQALELVIDRKEFSRDTVIKAIINSE